SVQGFVDDRFAPVGAVFEQSLADGTEVGASVCVNVDGRTVVDLWGGHADAARARPWQRDTIGNVYSCAKTIAALAALRVPGRPEPGGPPGTAGGYHGLTHGYLVGEVVRRVTRPRSATRTPKPSPSPTTDPARLPAR